MSKSHFKLPVRLGVCMGTAVDTDKRWRQQAVLELGDAYQQGRTVHLSAFCNLYVADEHQGYTVPHG